MRILTYSECAEWCAQRDYPIRPSAAGFVETDLTASVNAAVDLEPPQFHFVRFTTPTDSGRRVWLAKFLYLLLAPAPELLIWLGDSAVWPSGQHMPLFIRFRETFGEERPLIKAPGHILNPEEKDDAISIISVSLIFMWNCHILSASGRDAVFTSHDEFGWFASRDAPIVKSVEGRLRGAIGQSTDMKILKSPA